MTEAADNPPEVLMRRPSRLKAIVDSDLVYSFLRSKVTIGAAAVTLVIVLAAILAPYIAPKNPYDLTQISILDSNNPPIWMEGGQSPYVLGTDDQGRDVFSTILYGSRQSLAIGLMAPVLAGMLGISLGLVAGYAGGATDAFIMRAADVQSTFPAILIAILIDGTSRALFGEQRNE